MVPHAALMLSFALAEDTLFSSLSPVIRERRRLPLHSASPPHAEHSTAATTAVSLPLLHTIMSSSSAGVAALPRPLLLPATPSISPLRSTVPCCRPAPPLATTGPRHDRVVVLDPTQKWGHGPVPRPLVQPVGWPNTVRLELGKDTTRLAGPTVVAVVCQRKEMRGHAAMVGSGKEACLQDAMETNEKRAGAALDTLKKTGAPNYASRDN
nr:unnamed protein product [Digitaria exilis]